METWTPSHLIVNQCYSCRRYRPKTKSQCEFYRHISGKKSFDMEDMPFLCDMGCRYYEVRDDS